MNVAIIYKGLKVAHKIVYINVDALVDEVQEMYHLGEIKRNEEGNLFGIDPTSGKIIEIVL